MASMDLRTADVRLPPNSHGEDHSNHIEGPVVRTTPPSTSIGAPEEHATEDIVKSDDPSNPPVISDNDISSIDKSHESETAILLKRVIPFTNLDSADQVVIRKQLQLSPTKSTEDAWDTLSLVVSASSISSEKRDNLNLAILLDRLSDGSSRLQEAVQKDDDVHSIRDFARLFKARDIAALLEDDKKDLADQIRTEMFRNDPAGVAKGMLEKGEILPNVTQEAKDEIGRILVSKDFLTAQNELLAAASSQPASSDSISTSIPIHETSAMLRSFNLAKNPDSFRTMVQDDLSASSIATSNRPLFVKAMAPRMGGEDVANDVFEAASQKHTETTALLMDIRSQLDVTSPALTSSMITDPSEERNRRVLQVKEQLLARGVNLSLEDLFGPMEQSIIDESQVSTVYSPSAYFVELLLYLRNNNLSSEDFKPLQTVAGQPDSFEGTALGYLLNRRPDLIHIELTPQNANTILPYVDLANEVMESFVIYMGDYYNTDLQNRQTTVDAYNVLDQDSDYLLSQPQNVRIEAYRKLAAAVYPITLPYHQPLDAQRAFLQNLGCSKLELVSTFRPKALELDESVKAAFDEKQVIALTASAPEVAATSTSPADAMHAFLATYQAEALDNQKYCEVLGICQEEYLIWTKTVFWRPEHFQLTENLASLTTEEYRRRIGFKPSWTYWGYDTSEAMLNENTDAQSGISFVKKQLLPRAGISYTDLIEALKTQFVNPYYPTGRDKIILDTFSASYRYLQTLVDTPSPDMYNRVADFLSRDDRTLAVLFKLTGRVNNQSQDLDEIIKEQTRLALSRLEIRNWVLRNFQSIGKIIVLESGQGPKLQSTGFLIAFDEAGTEELDLTLTATILNGELTYQKTNKKYKKALIGQIFEDGSLQALGGRLGGVELDGAIVSSRTGQSFRESFPRLRYALYDTLANGGRESSVWTIRDGQLLTKAQIDTENQLGGNPSPQLKAQLEKDLATMTDSSPWILTEGLGGTSDIENVRLLHLDGTSLQLDEWDRLHRFLRIWRRLDWSALDTDRAVYTLSTAKPSTGDRGRPPTGGDGHNHTGERLIKFHDFTDEPAVDTGAGKPQLPPNLGPRPVEITGLTVQQLAATVDILKLTSLRVEELLTFWVSMPSSKPSPQYDKIFGRRNIRGTSKAFDADSDGNYFSTKATISANKLAIVAAIGMKLIDLEYLLSDDAQEMGITDELTMSNLTIVLSRYILAKILGVKITDLLGIITAFGNPFSNATSCLDFLQKWNTLGNIPFSWPEVRYVVETVSSPRDPMALTHLDSLRMSKQLRDNVLKIQKDYPVTAPQAEGGDAYAKRVMSLILEPTTVSRISELLQGKIIHSAEVDGPSLDADVLNKVIKDTVSGTVKYTTSIKSTSITKPATLNVTGILDEPKIKLLKETINLYMGQKQIKSKKDRKIMKSCWYLAIDDVVNQPREVFLDTLVGLLPTSVVAKELDVSIVDKVILAPDKTEDTSDSATTNDHTISTNGLAVPSETTKLASGEPQASIELDGINGHAPVLNGHDASDESDEESIHRSQRKKHASTGKRPKTQDSLDDDEDTESDGTGRTPAQKTEYFLKYYMPYLHKRLTYDSVVNTIASFTTIKDVDIVRTLLESVVKSSEESNESALDFVIRSVNDDVYSWQGYFRTDVAERFVFIVNQQDKPADLEFTPLLAGNRMDSALFVEGQVRQEFLSVSGQSSKGASATVKFTFTEDKIPGRWKSNEQLLAASTKYAVRLPLELKNNLRRQLSAFDTSAVNKNYWTAWWRGYLCPTSSDVYLFAAESDEYPGSLSLNSRRREFYALSTRGQTKMWTTDLDVPDADQKLTASMLYTLELEKIQSSDLMWKVGGNTRVKIPDSALLPDIAPTQMYAILSKMRKLGIFLEKFPLTSQELLFINSHDQQFSEIQPMQGSPHAIGSRHVHTLNLDGIHSVEECLQINEYINLKNSLPQTSSRSLIELFGWASEVNAEPTKGEELSIEEELTTQICLTTNWPRKQVQSMLREVNGVVMKRDQFRNQKLLSAFARMVNLSRKLAIDVATLLEWAGPTGTSSKDFYDYDIVSQSIQRLVKSRYDHDVWTQAIRPINNILRENQKNALIAYLLSQRQFVEENEIVDADGLFEYFLIDVQMTPLVETSRLVQATSTVQLFIQRCFLGLEQHGDRGVSPIQLDRKRWNWMNTYRVWEANRKIFLYPENWIEPSLRDNKSEIFKELESELLQKNLSTELVNTALKNFLYSVNNVSNLVAIGVYVGRADDVPIHVFARTRTSPFAYYHNSFSSTDPSRGSWSGWQLMQTEIPYITSRDPTDPNTRNGNSIAPVQFQGRLIVFAAEFTQRTVVNQPQGDWLANAKGSTSTSPSAPKLLWEIKMSWTEYRNGRWIARQTCPATYRATDETRRAENFVIVPSVGTDSVGVYVYSPLDVQPGTVEEDADGNLVVKTLFGSSVPSQTVTLTSWSFDGTQLSKVDRNMVITTHDKMPLKRSFGVAELQGLSKRIYSTQATEVGGKLRFDEASNNGIGIDDADSVVPKVDGSSGPSVYFAQASQPFFNNTIKRLMSVSTQVDSYTSTLNELGQISLPRDPRTGKISGLPVATGQPLPAAITKFLDTFGGSIGENDALSYNERRTMYSLYNWEIGLHAPMLLIDSLFKSQQYEQALRACHGIFDPLAADITIEKDTSRFWKFAPFKSIARTTIERTFMRLKAGEQDNLITEWRNNPFQPHVIARGRPQAYMRWIVYTYIKILIAWGDSLFKLNTLEAIPQAIQMYILSSHIYGPRGYQIPRQGKLRPETFFSLSKKFDAFSNAMVQLELVDRKSNQTSLRFAKLPGDPEVQLPNIFGSAATLYFAIPDNPEMRALATTIDDRLFKIRNSQDITGKFRRLPLFAPPIDPALLVLATAQGLSLGSILQDLQGPLPACKFNLILQKAFDLIAEVKGLGQSLVSIRERKDGEMLQKIRQRHEIAMQTKVMDIKLLALDDANSSLANLEYARTGAVSKLAHFLSLVGGDISGIPAIDREFQELDAKIEKPIAEGGLGLSPYEQESMTKHATATTLNYTRTGISTAAAILHALPNIEINILPVGVGGTTKWGPEDLAKGMDGAAHVIGIASEVMSNQASLAGTKSSYQRALQDRVLSANMAGYEVANINKQITAAKIRIAMTSKEIEIQQQQIDQSREIGDYLRDKYSTVELYSWLDGVTKTLYHQLYTQAFALARKAEAAYKFERPQKAKETYLQAGYFDAAHDGLLAGENLHCDLKRLEATYMDERGYDFEITKTISLRMLSPLALIKLREEGTCDFSVDELLFDMDFPGHYLRRIKSVNLTVPCVVGSYTSINATLTLSSSEYRITPAPGTSYGKSTSTGADQDPRFASVTAPISSIALCGAQNEAGVFQLDFSDQSARYLPFEGAGAISKWKLTLPDIRQFDYDTIYDVVMQIRYTSISGPGALQTAAQGAVKDFLKRKEGSSSLFALFDIKNEYATPWSQAVAQLPGKQASFRFNDIGQRLPFYTQNRNKEILNVKILADQQISDVALLQSSAGDTAPVKANGKSGDKLFMYDSGTGVPEEFLRTGGIQFNGTTKPRKCFMCIEYYLK